MRHEHRTATAVKPADMQQHFVDGNDHKNTSAATSLSQHFSEAQHQGGLKTHIAQYRPQCKSSQEETSNMVPVYHTGDQQGLR
mmetsp:Transcript_30391/g.80779  ORF Transcript_30391/g.80779 Transcript_30391/m.80779 type:complete len:83 (+) Transcript_30391:691-939(+)